MMKREELNERLTGWQTEWGNGARRLNVCVTSCRLSLYIKCSKLIQSIDLLYDVRQWQCGVFTNTIISGKIFVLFVSQL